MALPLTELARDTFALYNADGTARRPGAGAARWGTEIEALLLALAADALDIEFPYGFIKAENAGAGTPNAIAATTDRAIPEADGGALIALPIVAENTASPVTVSFNGDSPLTIKTVNGDDIGVGELTSGMIAAGYLSGSTFRLITDPNSLVHKQAAEAARAAAEAARDLAAGYASDAVSQGNVPIYAASAGVGAISVPIGMNAIRVNGYAAAGDGGGGLATREASEPAHGPKLQDASGAWFFIRTPRLDIRQFGAFGSDNEDALVNETVSIRQALTAAAMRHLPLYVPGAHYQFAGHAITDAFKLYLKCDPHNRPVFHGTQGLADAAGTLLSLNRTAYDLDSGMLNVAANVYPGQKKITLSSVTGLAAGMMIQWASNVLWYHDPRGDRYKGELHRIARVLEGTNQIEIDDAAWDFYDVSGETLTVRAWWPDELVIEHLEFVMPTPTTPVATAGLATDRLINPRLDGLRFRGSTHSGCSLYRSWRLKADDIEVENINSTGTGYGIQDRGGAYSEYRHLKSFGGRRLIDFHSLADTVSAPARGWLVEDFIVTGGGVDDAGAEYFPNGAVSNWGVGTHGPSENGVFKKGLITGVSAGVLARGRNTEVKDVRFLGGINYCVHAHSGTGLVVEGCQYDRMDYPHKVVPANLNHNNQARSFVRFGSGAENYDYGLPTRIQNNVANGLRLSFLSWATTGIPRNITCKGNTAIVHAPNGGNTFRFYDPEGVDIRIHSSDIGPNTLINTGDGVAKMFDEDTANFRIGDISQNDGRNGAVKVSGDTWIVRMGDDTAARIPNIGLQGDQVALVLSTSFNGIAGAFALRVNSGDLLGFGTLPATLVGTNAPTSLNGTSGTDGNFTVGLTAEGDVWMENRTGATRRVVVKAIG